MKCSLCHKRELTFSDPANCFVQHFGQGVMKYSNGDVYEGMFEYDLRSKNGKMTYKDGSVYDGSWLNGLVRMLDYRATLQFLLMG